LEFQGQSSDGPDPAVAGKGGEPRQLPTLDGLLRPPLAKVLWEKEESLAVHDDHPKSSGKRRRTDSERVKNCSVFQSGRHICT
jgi:hypothetical protein